MTLAMVMVALFALLAIGVPVGFAMGVSGALGLLVGFGPNVLLGVLETTPISALNSYELITIPMFLLMAEMVLISGVADDLFKTAAAWFGRIPGGLGIATTLAGAGFGASGTFGRLAGSSWKGSFEPTARRSGVSGCSRAAATAAWSVIALASPLANRF